MAWPELPETRQAAPSCTKKHQRGGTLAWRAPSSSRSTAAGTGGVLLHQQQWMVDLSAPQPLPAALYLSSLTSLIMEPPQASLLNIDRRHARNREEQQWQLASTPAQQRAASSTAAPTTAAHIAHHGRLWVSLARSPMSFRFFQNWAWPPRAGHPWDHGCHVPLPPLPLRRDHGTARRGPDRACTY